VGFNQGSIAQVIKMRKLRWFSALAALALAACGGGNSCGTTSFANTCGNTGGPPPIVVASVLLVSDASAIPSDNSLQANMTAYVRDANNNFVPNVPVVFTSDSGGVTVSQATTDANGIAKAALSTLADKTNRTITVTATANKVVGTATVNVIGSVIDLQGPLTLTQGQQAPYTVALTDAGGKGIANTAITVQPPANLTVNSTTLTTDNQGRATVTATGASGGSGSLTVSGLGLSKSLTVAVNADALTFSAPAANTTIALNTTQSVTAHWVQNGAPVANQPINIATTRGCINPAATVCTGQSATIQINTNASGDATVLLLSDNAGGATVTATTTNGTAANLSLQFIAVTPASIDVQPSVFTLAPGDQSILTAVVRDANNNLVTGATVVFSLNDVTGGTLSTASANTDLQGRAQTVYTAGSGTSAAGGVKITATIQSNSAINKTVGLTVAKRQVFISIGTGNSIVEPNAAQYSVDYVVQVTDSTGAGVKGVSMAMSVLSQRYFKGIRVLVTASSWGTCYTVPNNEANCKIGTPPSAAVSPGCADEDFNRNGVLDPGENQNGNNPATGTPTIEAGNIATVAPTSAGSFVTDANGFAYVTVFYPQEYAYYLQVTLQAQASVQGTAFSASSTFLLPGIASDFNNKDTAPPGITSPFGKAIDCNTY
jgi:Bacterial Ig-like domain (group 1)